MGKGCTAAFVHLYAKGRGWKPGVWMPCRSYVLRFTGQGVLHATALLQACGSLPLPACRAAPAPAGAVIAAVAYRRPKAAAFLVGAVTLATAPYIGFMVASMNR
jgi:hypothetical protein